jgi:arylsulfatase A-like enzyme
MLKDEVDYEFFESVGPLRGLKGDVFEGGIRVPMIARWPGRIAENSETAHISANYDFLATLTELVGIHSVPETDSVSFLPTLFGKADKQQRHEHLFWDFAGYGGQLAVRMGDWKGVRLNLIENRDAPFELYNLKDDIGESNNVAAEYPEVAAKIQRIMLDDRIKPVTKSFQFGQYRPE